MGRVPEYEVKKVRQPIWTHPKTKKWLKRLAKKHGCKSVGQLLDRVREGKASLS